MKVDLLGFAVSLDKGSVKVGRLLPCSTKITANIRSLLMSLPRPQEMRSYRVGTELNIEPKTKKGQMTRAEMCYACYDVSTCKIRSDTT